MDMCENTSKTQQNGSFNTQATLNKMETENVDSCNSVQTKADSHISMNGATLPAMNGIVGKNSVKVKLKKKIKRLSREKLENLVATKVQKHLKAEREIKNLKNLCKQLQKEVGEWKHNTDKLSKSYQDLANFVNSKGNVESKSLKSVDRLNSPVQVQEKSQSQSNKSLDISTSPAQVQEKNQSKSNKSLDTSKSLAQVQEKSENMTTKSVNTLKSPVNDQEKGENKSSITPETLKNPAHKNSETHSSSSPPLEKSESKSSKPLEIFKKPVPDLKEINAGSTEEVLPPFPKTITLNNSLPTPLLKLTQTKAGLEVFWTHTSDHTAVSTYELFAFRRQVKLTPNAAWMKVGDVKSIPLPIRCTLSAFKTGSTYSFIVRSKDSSGHVGVFSGLKTISLV